LGRNLAIFISYLFHPLWMPLYVFLIFFNLQYKAHMFSHGNSWLYILLLIFLNTILIPVFLFYFMRKFGLIGSLQMESRKDRFLPFLVTGIFYLTTAYVLNQVEVFENLAHVFYFSAVLTFIGLILTSFWKISIHSMALGAVTGLIIYLTGLQFFDAPWLAYSTIMVSGLVGFARLKLDAHSPAQVYGGYLLGVLAFSLTMLWLIN